ncbi:MAG: DNA-formamidopyrimidine glycosylase [Gemmatimonadales bacterium]|nr:DNA-formamidopyrimidine glycosylase [Gemmatimonadales bacterium]
MPELPEAETIVRGIRTPVVGRTIQRVRVIHSDVLRQPTRLVRSRAIGATISGVGRRGKNVLIEVGERGLIAVNLGMTGGLLPFPSPPERNARPSHQAVVFTFESGGVLVFNDTRRFGTVEVLTTDEWAERSGRMGPEPLSADFTPEHLFERTQRSRAPMRSWLLDQKKIAGVGNIYAAEALFLSGVHPQEPAHNVPPERAGALHGHLRDVLNAAIDAGGTTIKDYRNAEGGSGEYARKLWVYGRDGEPCLTCGETIVRVVFSNRSAFFCPRCQPQ